MAGADYDPKQNVVGTDVASATLKICKVSQSSPQSVPTATNTTVTYDTEDSDVLGWHTGTSGSVIPLSGPGWYRATFNAWFDASISNTARYIFILNAVGVEVAKVDQTTGPARPSASLSAVVYMNGSTDTFYVVSWQDHGSNIDIQYAALTVEYLGL